MTDTTYALPPVGDRRVALYAEHCVLAGQRCWDEGKIERASDDLVIYDVDELGGLPAALHVATQMTAVGNPWTRRAGKTLLMYWGR